MRFIFRGNRRPYGIPPPRPLLLFSSAMPCFLGTPNRCPPPPCPFPSARRSSLAPSRPSDYLLPSPASFPAPAFSRTSVLFGLLSPVSTLLMTDYSFLHLPCPGIPFLGIRPPRSRPSSSLLVPSRSFSSLLVPSRPFFSPSRPLLCIPCFRPRPCRSFFREAGDFGMKMRNTSLFGK